MIASNNQNPRDKGLDLHRRARELGVTPGHLSRVLSGQRQSARLLLQLEKLMESERTNEIKPSTSQH
jgi:transcriptional regulator with XRE-family HTH domain